MILCDIGNSFYHFYQLGYIWKVPVDNKKFELPNHNKLFYISVNDKASKKLKKISNLAKNIEDYIEFNSSYTGLGIDRKLACIGSKNGVVVDAGSAITVDVMQNNVHLGGYILPGLSEFQNSYKNISKKLDYKFNFRVDLNCSLPQNTRDAISYGALKSINSTINEVSRDKKIYFTGGDGKFLSKFFNNSIYDESIIFKGMLKIIKG